MANSSFSTLVLIGLMVFAFYFLILRPQRKRQQALQRTMSELVPGSRVMLGSGLFGTVVSVGEKQVVLEISPGAELTVLKQAIARVVTDADEDVEEPDDQLDNEAISPEQGIDPASAPPEVAPRETTPDQQGDPRTGPTGIKD